MSADDVYCYNVKCFDKESFSQAIEDLRLVDIKKFQEMISHAMRYAPRDMEAFGTGLEVGRVIRVLRLFQKSFIPPPYL